MSDSDTKQTDQRYRCIANVTVRESKRQLKNRVRKMREEERMARRRDDERQAELYRRAGNAIESAIAELENYDSFGGRS